MSGEPRTGETQPSWTPWNKGKLTGPMQQPVQFEPTDQTRESVTVWNAHAKLPPKAFRSKAGGVSYRT